MLFKLFAGVTNLRENEYDRVLPNLSKYLKQTYNISS